MFQNVFNKQQNNYLVIYIFWELCYMERTKMFKKYTTKVYTYNVSSCIYDKHHTRYKDPFVPPANYTTAPKIQLINALYNNVMKEVSYT